MERVGRNDPCPCGSGKKFKKCCESKVAKRAIGNAQVLGGSQKMSSLFSRNVKPITSSGVKKDIRLNEESKSEGQPGQEPRKDSKQDSGSSDSNA